MSSMLSRITSGRIQKPQLLILYGPDGVGKSTFAAQAPRPVFLGPESGTSELNVSRFPSVTRFDQVGQAIHELLTERHEFETLVLDSLDWLEPLLWQQVCEEAGSANIEEAYGGFGKGFTVALKHWRTLHLRLAELREVKKMNLVFIAHSQVKAFNDPNQLQPYDRYMLKLNEKAAAVWREFVDCVFFADYEVFLKKEGAKSAKAKALGDGSRILYTERKPSFDAKNRFGLPAEIPFKLGTAWDDYMAALRKAREAGKDIEAEIMELVPGIFDGKVQAQVREYVQKSAGDVSRLTGALNRVKVILTQQQGEKV